MKRGGPAQAGVGAAAGRNPPSPTTEGRGQRPLLRFLAAAVLGVATTLAFAPFGYAPLAPLALAILFWLARPLAPRRAFLLGWCYGIVHFGSGIYWVYISTHIYGGAPAWLGALMGATLFAVLGLFPALVLGVAAGFRLWQRPAGWVGVPALWLLGELLRGWVYSGFPWLSLGYVTTDLSLNRLAPLVGVHGISALLAALAYALSRLASNSRIEQLRAAALVAFLGGASLLLPAATHWTRDSGAPLDVAIIQGNIAQDQKWQKEMQEPTLRRFHDMTLAAKDADLIVWPEVALTPLYHQVRESYLEPLGEEVRAAGGGTLLAGIVVLNAEPKGYYNSVIALGASGGRFDKRHLVPFGEYFPIPAWLRPIMDVLGTPYSDFLVGAEQQAPIVVKGQRLGVSICFEDVFGSELRRDARDAGLLVNVTNDAWFGRSPAAWQHLQIARMRALENGRPFVRAANTGISAVIGPDGGLQAHAGHFTTEILRASVQPRTGVTPYGRWGNAPLWGLALAMLLALIVLHRRALVRGRSA
ncbi:MAG TPA: apolipoprotein N-acyltransferase [Solimonas sp.]|nr:apolipoprotein N-acyltransferase [Solimonas sp.]